MSVMRIRTAATFALFACSTAFAQGAHLLEPSDLTNFDSFGADVAIDGDTVVVACPSDDLPGSHQPFVRAGSAYVYVRSSAGWILQQKLHASDAAPGFAFGSSVAICGDRIAVGSRNAGTTFAGATYVFERTASSWTEVQILTAPTPVTATWFGLEVALWGDMLVSGDRNGNNFVFEQVGGSWTYLQTVTVPASSSSVHRVDIDGTTMALSSTASREVHVFQRGASLWVPQQVLSDPGPIGPFGPTATRFGFSMDLLGDRIVVGAPWAELLASCTTLVGPFGTTPDCDPGAAYVFERGLSGWTQSLPTLVASDAQENDEFAAGVAIGGTNSDVVLCGLPRRAPSTVFGYVIDGGSWIERGRLDHDPAPTTVIAYGWVIAMSGETCVIGAPASNVQAGKAFVFDCLRDHAAVDYGAATGSTFGDPSLTTTAPPVLGETAELTVVEPLPTAAFGLLLVSTARDTIPLFNGTILVDVNPIVATVPITPSPTGTTISFSVPLDPSMCAASFPYTFQALFADFGLPGTATPFGLTFTNGVEWWVGRF